MQAYLVTDIHTIITVMCNAERGIATASRRA